MFPLSSHFKLRRNKLNQTKQSKTFLGLKEREPEAIKFYFDFRKFMFVGKLSHLVNCWKPSLPFAFYKMRLQQDILMGLMNGRQWNPVGRRQVNWCLFTARLGFEPTTETIGL